MGITNFGTLFYRSSTSQLNRYKFNLNNSTLPNLPKIKIISNPPKLYYNKQTVSDVTISSKLDQSISSSSTVKQIGNCSNNSTSTLRGVNCGKQVHSSKLNTSGMSDKSDKWKENWGLE